MADNFDLQGWMRENKQGPFAGLNQETFKSSKPKSKTGLNEGLMGMIDLQPVGGVMMEDMEDDDFAATTAEVWASPSGELDAIIEFNGKKARVVEKTGEDVDKFWKMIAMKAKKMGATHIHSEENDPETESIEDILSSYMDEDSDIPTNDQDYTTQPGYVHEDDEDDAPEIEDTWNKPSEFDKDDDEEKMAAMAMKQAKSGKKGMKGITADWTIDDILGGDDDDF